MLTRAAAHIRIAQSLGDMLLYHGCLEVMARRLHFNVSQCRSSYEPNPATRPDSITHSLEYACLQWIYHVASVPGSLTIDKEIEVAFQARFLFWLEVVSTLKRVERAAAMLMFATSTVSDPCIRCILYPLITRYRFGLRAFVASCAMHKISSRRPVVRLREVSHIFTFLHSHLHRRTRSSTRHSPHAAPVSSR